MTQPLCDGGLPALGAQARRSAALGAGAKPRRKLTLVSLTFDPGGLHAALGAAPHSPT